VATARNYGARVATGDLLIFLDDDMLVEPDHISAHLRAREKHGDCLVNGHWVFSESTESALRESPFGRYRIRLDDDIRARFERVKLGDGRYEVTKVTAANLGVSSATFKSLGGFDESFPYAGYEDQELSFRAQIAGHRFVYDPAIRLQHNDERVTLEQFARRYQRGAVTAVYLAGLHPDTHAGSRLLVENAGVTRHDPASLRAKKLLKLLASSRPGIWLLRHLIRQVERRAPSSDRLARLYSMMIGVFIFRGVRAGLKQNHLARRAVIEVMRKRAAGA
jgi:GT2 family glycosyltransferase